MGWNKELFDNIVKLPSPVSEEGRLQAFIYNYLKHLGYNPECDAMGNVYTKINHNYPTVLIQAHADQVALQVKEITEAGFLKFRKIGAIDIHSFYGQCVNILNKKGIVKGIIGRDPRNISESKSGFTIKTSDMWVDIGAENKDVAENIVSVNDFIVFAGEPLELLDGRVATVGGDDKIGIYTILKVAKNLSDKKDKFGFNLCFATSVQEEIGSRGARSLAQKLQPNCSIIVDVEYATDYPNGNNYVVLGKGPVLTKNADNNSILLEIAAEIDTKVQFAYTPSFDSSTDAESFITAASNCASMNVSIPLRNMHSASEVFDVKDVEATVQFIVNVIIRLDNVAMKNDTFSPVKRYL